MKLALTLEADRINVQALNMGQIVVDVDGVNLTELINKVAENGYSLRVVEESDQQSTCTPPPFATLAGIRCSNRTEKASSGQRGNRRNGKQAGANDVGNSRSRT